MSEYEDDVESLLKEGARAMKALLYPVPAYGAFLTPRETARYREQAEKWLYAVDQFFLYKHGGDR